MEESVSYGLMNQYGGEDECGIRPMGPTRDDRGQSGHPGMVRHNVLSDRMFTTPESRQLSFRNWPRALKQEPATLAEAGFYYIGESDHVKCFHCSLGLRDWEDEDCPWKEHAKFSPSCSFMRLAKGDDFIERAVRELGQQQQAMYAPEENERRTSIHSTSPPSPPGCCFSTSPQLVSMGSSSRSSTSLPSSSSSSSSPPTQPADTEPPSPGPPQVLSLEDENTRLRDEKLCKICWSAQVGVTFIPCGHFVCCVNCCLALSACPLCRRKIDGSVRTFMS